MRSTYSYFVSGYSTCQSIKDSTLHTPGLLQPLPIPFLPFERCSLDLITNLPLSHGCNAIFSCMDCLAKLCRLILCFLGGSQLGAVVACHFIDLVVRHYGMPLLVVHDQDPRFMSAFQQALLSYIGTKCLFSTSHQPQTDRQTECHYCSIEQVLRSFIL